jgi:hypothetical protein
LAHSLVDKVEAAYRRGDLIDEARPAHAGDGRATARRFRRNAKILPMRAGQTG